ncbi:unnamed protein product [Spodoptera littoralis]|uniref:Glutathione transferase n=1 Tax=Spodoptera littoralis TaxID=7109 RepID=A0A9P0IFG4_SPOLI|nr:unnamed protein product [Spodoptera littoralis]
MAPLLYKSNTSPPANAVRMLADIIGLHLDLKDVSIPNMEHKSPEHLKRNPMGTIPTLIDGDFIISESHATMKYLLSVYSDYELRESLYPSDVRTRAVVDQCMFFNAGVFFPKLLGCVLPAVFGDLDGPTEQHKAEIDAAYSVLEAYLKDHKYIAADHLTLADLSVGATAISIQVAHKLDATKFPLTAAWISSLEDHPSFKKILLPGVQLLNEFVNAAWQKNRK